MGTLLEAAVWYLDRTIKGNGGLIYLVTLPWMTSARHVLVGRGPTVSDDNHDIDDDARCIVLIGR